MKKIILLSFIILASQVKADRLWSVNELYELGEVLHSSSRDYDQGFSLSFLSSYEAVLSGKGFSYNGDCVVSSHEEIISVVRDGISKHLNYNPDEEFNFSYALDSLKSNLSSYYKIYKCDDGIGKKIFISDLNEFVLSYEIF